MADGDEVQVEIEPFGRLQCRSRRPGGRLHEAGAVLGLARRDAPGLLTDAGVVDLSSVVPPRATPQRHDGALIDDFDDLRPRLEQLAADGPRCRWSRCVSARRCRGPARSCAASPITGSTPSAKPRPLNMFLKNPDAVIGPGDTVQLPELHRAVDVHARGRAGRRAARASRAACSAENWRSAVFGYTGMMDITGRGEGRSTWGRGTWIGKSFDTFCPIGPCITTADEIPDPNDLWVQFWNDGQLRHNYNTDDMEHRVPELVEFASRTLTLRSGDLICCGTNHEGLGPVQDGETLELLIHGIGR